MFQKRRYEKVLEIISSKNIDFKKRVLFDGENEVTILYIKQLTDANKLSEYIIRPIMQYASKNKVPFKADVLVQSVIYAEDCTVEQNDNNIIDILLNGKAVLLLANDKHYITANIKKIERKPISNPELTFTLRGPKDSFTEDLDTNISLIRYRIKDENLKIDYFEIGERTKAKVGVIYIKDVVNSKHVQEIRKRIKDICVGGIVESGELQAFLLNNKYSLFPQMGIVERSDMACGALLEGKTVILTEGSGIGLIAPKTLSEYLWSCEDNYDNKFFGAYSRLLRIFAIFLTLTVTPLYVALVSFRLDVLPADYIIAIASSRATVPFNTFTEALILEGIVEILREAMLRVPKQIGPAIGIVGAIVIGEAAISAGLFSPLLLIIVSLSLLTSFVSPDYTLVNPLRVLKAFMLVLTGVFGVFGFVIGLNMILTNTISTNSLGVPVLAPFSPMNVKDEIKSIFYNKSIVSDRPNFLNLKNNVRKRDS